jgi:hypothetical protein
VQREPKPRILVLMPQATLMPCRCGPDRALVGKPCSVKKELYGQVEILRRQFIEVGSLRPSSNINNTLILILLDVCVQRIG